MNRAPARLKHPPLCTPPVAHLASADGFIDVTETAQQNNDGGGSALAALPNYTSAPSLHGKNRNIFVVLRM